MTFSEPVLGTGNTKTKLNWWEYWIGHCWMTGWQSIGGAFRIWSDLMTDNFDDYALPKTVEDPFEECRDWFWVSLGEDNTYPIEFLEYLQQMMNDIETGKEKLIPLDESLFDRLRELVGDIDLDEDDLR
jgi:hypothetical protein